MARTGEVPVLVKLTKDEAALAWQVAATGTQGALLHRLRDVAREIAEARVRLLISTIATEAQIHSLEVKGRDTRDLAKSVSDASRDAVLDLDEGGSPNRWVSTEYRKEARAPVLWLEDGVWLTGAVEENATVAERARTTLHASLLRATVVVHVELESMVKHHLATSG